MITAQVTRGYHSPCGIHEYPADVPSCPLCDAALAHERSLPIEESVPNKARRLLAEGHSREDVAEMMGIILSRVISYSKCKPHKTPEGRRAQAVRAREANTKRNAKKARAS